MAPDSVERREDLATRGRVQEVLFAVVQERKRIKAHIRLVEAACAAMGVTLIVCMAAIFGVPFTGVDGLVAANTQRARESEATARESKQVADANRRLVSDIQSERERNIRAACERDNRSARRRERALRRFNIDPATRAFVRAVLPEQEQDCDVVVSQQIPSATKGTSRQSRRPPEAPR